MRINNLNELYNHIRTKLSLSTNGSLLNLIACIDQYKNICNCKAKEKGQKLFECNNQYVYTINNLDPDTISMLLNSTEDKNIEFYNESIFIRTISE